MSDMLWIRRNGKEKDAIIFVKTSFSDEIYKVDFSKNYVYYSLH